MENSVAADNEFYLGLVTEIVSAYVSNNPISRDDLPSFISQVDEALKATGLTAQSAVAVGEPQKPAVSVRKSKTEEALFCLECGKPHKSLKRHIRTSHDLSPDDYRAKWKLPVDYPMVAPAYAATRSQLAKDAGLGQKGHGRR